MPHTNRSLIFLWLIMSALFAMSASGALVGWWLVLLVAVALASPALVLRRLAQVTATSLERPLIADQHTVF